MEEENSSDEEYQILEEETGSIEDLATFFKKHKIKKGIRVAAYMPNQIETVECFLATAAIGAIWSSCSPDF